MQIVRFVIQFVVLGFMIAAGILLYRQYSDTSPATQAAESQARPEQVQLIQSNAEFSPSSGPFSYSDAVNRGVDSVVNIYTAKRIQQRQQFQNPLYDRFFGQQYNQSNSRVETGSGSGVIFTQDGYLLTNFHVIEDAQEIHVLLHDGRDYPAQLIGVDPETDLAVLHIQETGLQPITLAPGNSANVGDVVLAIGNPFGVGQTVTMGIISATGRDRLGLNTFENFLQTDAAINPGNSGGALINARGDLVGINTAIFSKDGGSQGIGFAIPVSIATNVLTQILKNGRVIRGWIGAEGRDLSSFGKEKFGLDHGVAIVGVVESGPAYLAGLRKGDIVTHIDGRIIRNIKDVLNEVSSRSPGEAMKLEGIRKNQTFEATIVVIQRPLMTSSPLPQ